MRIKITDPVKSFFATVDGKIMKFNAESGEFDMQNERKAKYLIKKGFAVAIEADAISEVADSSDEKKEADSNENISRSADL